MDEFALAIKINCSHLRAGEGNGKRKYKTDIQGIQFLYRSILQTGGSISDTCANMLQVGYYHMLSLYYDIDEDVLTRLKAIGVWKLLQPWNENSLDQRQHIWSTVEDKENCTFKDLEDEEVIKPKD